MKTLDEARAIALAKARQRQSRDVTIVDASTIEEEFGWLFFYDSTAFVTGGDRTAKLFGNAPIIVNRTDGRVSTTDTSLPAEAYLEAYKALGPDRYDAGEWRAYLAEKFPDTEDV